MALLLATALLCQFIISHTPLHVWRLRYAAEIVAVDEGQRAHGHNMRMLRVMTPHTSSVCPSAISMSGKAGYKTFRDKDDGCIKVVLNP